MLFGQRSSVERQMGIISELSVVMGTNLYHEIIQISLNIGIVEVLRPDDVRGLSASTNDVRFNMYVSCSLHSHVNIAISSYHSSNDRLCKWVGGIGRDVSIVRLDELGSVTTWSTPETNQFCKVAWSDSADATSMVKLWDCPSVRIGTNGVRSRKYVGKSKAP